ncbi:5-formyltetrahydrofolate cyclo-ligase [Vibrio sp. SM6]|uniref:5-formyltetrahydrofolate cyclo-ligase n=1 Tax=Vibrio agarilyticus TaxID=2726741 RepID=A0A7X8TQ94_9VIBR|nr:5-formyltetrahydrofolate cyclo-ligase [Vibrio agarilyticus]NLS12858.1 5-formyltetrahydrofolate cyclo-ligase [Vibrio agarilyticus]
MPTRHALRKQMRQRRQSLSPRQQREASHQLVERFTTLAHYERSEHIALYLTNDGELDTHPLIETLWQHNKSVYLPVLHPFAKGHLLFLRYQPDTPMTINRYGILEPQLRVDLVQPVRELDLIGTPLVAFDAKGQRLGMGGGYYDRTLAMTFSSSQPDALSASGPITMGLAHDCQEVSQLPVESWDVPLSKIVTPTRIITGDK